VRFYVDSADANEIRACLAQGLAAGVSAPVSADDREGMLREARALAKLTADASPPASAGATDLAVRLPCTAEGLAAARACAGEGIRTEIARCASPAEAVRAAQAGASYVSPPTGPTGAGAEAHDLVRKLVATLRSYDLPTEVLVAARSASQVVDAGLAGARGVTAPYAVLVQLGAQRNRDANPAAR
jgi:transaldolase